MIRTLAPACALTATLLLAPTALADTIYVAGTRGFGQTSDVSIGEAAYMTGDPDAIPVQYPRDLGPMIGSTTLDQSVEQALINLRALDDTPDTLTRIVGVSQGAVVLARYSQELAATNPSARVEFVTYGNPANADGGLLHKLPFQFPGATPVVEDLDTPFKTTHIVLEYDLVADAPDYPNPLSWANAVMGGMYSHATYTKDTGVYGVDDRDTITTVTGNVTHILVKSRDLPLTRPLRDFLGVDTRGIDSVLRPIVDSGYAGNRTRVDTPAEREARANPLSEKPKDEAKPVKDETRVDMTKGNKVFPRKINTKGGNKVTPQTLAVPTPASDDTTTPEPPTADATPDDDTPTDSDAAGESAA